MSRGCAPGRTGGAQEHAPKYGPLGRVYLKGRKGAQGQGKAVVGVFEEVEVRGVSALCPAILVPAGIGLERGFI